MPAATNSPQPNFQNRTLYHGDNLPFLRGMNTGTAHLVATDPPFNKNKDFHATPDSLSAGAKFEDRWRWDKDVQPDWLDQLHDDWPKTLALINAVRTSVGEDIAAYMCWLGVRLMEMHRVLRDDGSLYLHIDHTAHAYVKALMDTIFGRENFRNEIVWCYTGPGSPKMRQFNRKHDSLLWYSKGAKWTFNADAVRVPYKDGTPHTGGFKHVSGPKAGKNMDAETAASYTKGKVPEDWWEGIAIASRGKQNTGYPTQKPLELYERIIKASSNPGEFVLDPFCGCATTPVAAERLGRRWVGIDLWDGAHEIVVKRCKSERELQIDLSEIRRVVDPPARTDDAKTAAPMLVLKVQVPEPGKKMPNAEMKRLLVQSYGNACYGCGREFDAPDYLDLGHNTPRSQRGLNHISNRILVCGPCNRLMSDTLTVKGLRRELRNRPESHGMGPNADSTLRRLPF